jgi:hypothetical protein
MEVRLSCLYSGYFFINLKVITGYSQKRGKIRKNPDIKADEWFYFERQRQSTGISLFDMQ